MNGLKNWWLNLIIAAVFTLLGAASCEAAIRYPSDEIQAGHCYRIDARPGFDGYLAGGAHREVSCP